MTKRPLDAGLVWDVGSIQGVTVNVCRYKDEGKAQYLTFGSVVPGNHMLNAEDHPDVQPPGEEGPCDLLENCQIYMLKSFGTALFV